MNRDKYNEIIDKIEKGWPSDRITRESATKTILTCENGSFIKVGLMVLPEELLSTSSLKDSMHNKLLLQWTDDLEKPHYKNLARYIAKDELPPEGPMREALEELAFRVQLADVLE